MSYIETDFSEYAYDDIALFDLHDFYEHLSFNEKTKFHEYKNDIKVYRDVSQEPCYKNPDFCDNGYCERCASVNISRFDNFEEWDEAFYQLYLKIKGPRAVNRSV